MNLRFTWNIRLLLTMLIFVSLHAQTDEKQQRLFIIGQDLGSVRDYFSSNCCVQPDANTTYLDFYNLLSEEGGYGGLGIDPSGKAIDMETDWGAGPVNAWKSATEFGDLGIAIGLSITENDHPGALDDLVAGKYDMNIAQLAAFINQIGKSVYLRIGYEFDGSWNKGYQQPARWIKAYRRIVDGLRSAHVRNVEFVWQSATYPAIDLPREQREYFMQWYPGDEYVDWIGVSVFLGLDEKPAQNYQYQSPTVRQLLGSMLDFAREKTKPVMLAEAAPQGYDLAKGINSNVTGIWDGPPGENSINLSPQDIWQAWYQPLFDLLESNRDVIYALAYINCNWDVQDLWNPPYEGGYWGDSRVQASPYIAERFNLAIEKWRSDF